MQYTKYIATGVVLSLLSISTLVSATTGDVVAGGATVAATGVTVG